ncbi:acyltransferase family protein [Moraxella boevrei]|uniref:acyltransferase family protein n=1 Tax=Faucicola boevrei TaxID=346665 RepID=UPI0037368285
MQQQQKRLVSLDYLRGLCALSIVFYHVFIFNGQVLTPNHLLQRLGFYGVSIFYLLSGLTLYCIYYQQNFRQLSVIVDFFKKRVARLFPLLMLLTTFVYFGKPIGLGSDKDLMSYWLNMTGLFAWLDYDNYIVTGGWSIGNELVFYGFFPVLLWQNLSKQTIILWLSTLILLGIYIYFAFFVLNIHVPLAENWQNYINPLNQGFLFVLGMLIAKYFLTKNLTNFISLTLIGIGFLLFMCYPISANLPIISLVTGTLRLIFTLSSALLVLGFFKLTYQLPKILHRPLFTLGEISYGVYLIHPIVILLINQINDGLNFWLKLILTLLITLLLSQLSYQYFEKYFVKIMRKT